jgi:PHD/YefM family antitoxin component YafN of YafNO toxin-antitoxin module
MMNVDDLESLEETLEILSNPALMAAIRAGEDDAAEGRTERVLRDEMLARVARK